MVAFAAFYIALIALLSAYGVHRYWLVSGTLRPATRRVAGSARPPEDRVQDPVPRVLIQLPIYNEAEVVLRLIDSAAAVAWARNALEIQVLDDSDDGSSTAIMARVEEHRARGIPIEHIRRSDRRGYKAGALEAGLARSRAEFVAIFDADFVVPRDFLRRTVGLFRDARLAMVQARWGFLNADHSLLTEIQALLLDGHFQVEHTARAAAGRFFNFNGTAGIWRRAAIDDSGGWRAETVTEDLDLSLRAWLRGWRFHFVDDLEVPSALPEAMAAFKIQQNRWVAGSIQTARMFLGQVLRSRLRVGEKLDLVFYLTGNFIYLPLLLLALSIPPAVLLRLESAAQPLLWVDAPFFLFATVSVAAFYTRARVGAARGPRFYALVLPALMGLGLGLALHNSRAILRGLFGRARVFDSTPKGGLIREAGEVRRRRRHDPISIVEPVMAAYVLASSAVSLQGGSVLSLPFLGMFAWGYLYVFYQTVAPGARPGSQNAR